MFLWAGSVLRAWVQKRALLLDPTGHGKQDQGHLVWPFWVVAARHGHVCLQVFLVSSVSSCMQFYTSTHVFNTKPAKMPLAFFRSSTLKNILEAGYQLLFYLSSSADCFPKMQTITILRGSKLANKAEPLSKNPCHCAKCQSPSSSSSCWPLCILIPLI